MKSETAKTHYTFGGLEFKLSLPKRINKLKLHSETSLPLGLFLLHKNPAKVGTLNTAYQSRTRPLVLTVSVDAG